MGRKLVHTKNRRAPICERRRSGLRIQSQGEDTYTDQYGRVLVWSEKHRDYIPSRRVSTKAAVNSPPYKRENP